DVKEVNPCYHAGGGADGKAHELDSVGTGVDPGGCGAEWGGTPGRPAPSVLGGKVSRDWSRSEGRGFGRGAAPWRRPSIRKPARRRVPGRKNHHAATGGPCSPQSQPHRRDLRPVHPLALRLRFAQARGGYGQVS